MILGLLLDGLNIPVVPMVLMILSGVIQIIGFAYLIYKYRSSKSMEALDTAKFDKITHIVGKIFLVYAFIELVAVGACVIANDSCRGGYHYPAGTACPFCNGAGANTHSEVSDFLMLGIYYNAFIVNSYIVAAITTVKDFIASKKVKD